MVRVLIKNMGRHEPWWAEFWSAIAAVVWCLYAMAFIGANDMPSFRAVSAVVPTGVWYVFSILVPFGQIYALRRDDRVVRLALCCLMAWWWGFLCLAIFMSEPASPGLPLYFTFGCVNLFSLWRLGVRRGSRSDG